MFKIGVDIGGTKIACGVVDENGKIVFKGQKPTGKDRKDDEIIADIADLIREAACGRENEIEGVGIGVPGSVLNNVVLQCVNLSWTDMDLGGKLSKLIPYRIFSNNDANCALIGEYKYGACKEARNAIMLTLGTGVGGGILIDGKLYVGSHGNGAELGHLPLVFGGKHCPCHGDGCIEQYCSATALIALATEKAEGKLADILKKNGKLNAKNIMDLVKDGDENAMAIFEEYIRYLACAVNGIINAFDPDTVLLGGGISNAGTILIDALEKELDKIAYFDKNKFPRRICLSANGNDAGILGAAALVE